jgi:hypothetical protein
MVAPPTAPPVRSRPVLALLLLVGAGIAVAIGIYARVHSPASRPLFLLGFSGMLQLKTWLATVALVFVVVQLVTALWIWDRLPVLGPAPGSLPTVHRWSGSIGFTLTLPVAVHCVWSLGLLTSSPRVLAHGILGCAFYGAYAAKMLGLRLPGLPRWAIPVLGGTVFSLNLAVWTTSAAWFFTRSGVPLF